MSTMQKLWMRADGSAWGGYASCREGDVGSFAVTREADALAAIKAARGQALEEVAKLCDEFGDDYMQQAREGDNSGASDHKACAATEIADAIRLLGEDAGRGES